ncbi:hypothetical protein NC651_037790 [Populus alba x Populus x berolinensis]|nr:hypothetical protein NC651_037790 [Populus alba x Populus x berolinensis]
METSRATLSLISLRSARWIPDTGISIQWRGLKGINECYTWKIYANKLLSMGNMYSFWRQLNKEQKLAKQRYMQLFFNLKFRELVQSVPIPTEEGQTPVSEPPARTQSSASVKRTQSRCRNSRFTQQELPACKPILTPGWVITSFIVVGVVFIPIGLASLYASEHVPKHMKSPVVIYYELDNFYQKPPSESFCARVLLTCFCNLKCENFADRYVKVEVINSYEARPVKGVTETCKPEAVTSNGQPIVPCGLVAWSLFNDTYRFSVKKEVLDVSKKNIAWKSDQEHKFGSDVYPKNFQNGSLIGGGKLNSSIPLSETSRSYCMDAYCSTAKLQKTLWKDRGGPSS